MMIKTINLHDLHNEEHTGYCSYVSKYFDNEDIKLLNVEFQVTDFELKLSIEKSVLDIIKKNKFTETLANDDKKRDRLILGYFKVVRGMLHHFQPSIAKAAYNINLINENFGNITKLSYEKQTQAEESLLKALKEASDDVKKLGVMEWVLEIEKAHTTFVQLTSQRNTETDSKPIINMKNARLVTDAAYQALVDRINAFITIEGKSGPFESLVTQINGRIDQYATNVAKHKGRGKNNDTSSETKPQE